MAIHKKTEIVIGLLYATGTGFQAFDTLRHSNEFYVDMAEQAWIRPAEILTEEFLIPNSVGVTVLVVVLQATLAVAILTRGRWVGPALLVGGVFSIIGGLFGNPIETIGYGALAALHFKLASDRNDS